MKTTSSILTICVNYHNYEETVRFVRELLAQKNVSRQTVIVVDNTESCADDNPLTRLSKRDCRVWVVKAEKNLGYYRGAALGLSEYLKRNPLPDWVIVCNTDIEFVHGNFLENLCAFYGEKPCPVVAPSIYSSLSKQEQNPNFKTRPSRLRMHFYKWIFRFSVLLRLYEVMSLIKRTLKKTRHNSEKNQKRTDKPLRIYAPHGSFIIFHSGYFKKGGSLNHGSFLFGEEIFVAETARQLGLDIVYDPRLKVVHKEHATTSAFKNRAKRQAEAAKYCADTFFPLNSSVMRGNCA